MSNKILFIVNPRSGTMKGKRNMPAIEKLLSDQGYEVDTRLTTARGDACEFARSHSGGCDMIICSGGDGTLNEVLSGLMSIDERPPVGYIPSGTTNDFASSLKISKKPLTAAKNILSGTPRSLDLGMLNDRYFTYVASFGAFTDASYSAPQSLKNVLGKLVYVLEGIKDIGNIRKRRVRFETDDGVYEDDYIFGAVSNSTSIAGMIRLEASLVDFNDGLFEVMLIKCPKNIIELNKIINSLLSQKYDPDVLTFFHTSRALVTADPEMPWTLDGEFAHGCEKIEIKNIRNAFRLIC